MRLLSMLVAGLLFGTGLGLSGMAQPARVLGFLDVLGPWDPTLLFVMAGALAVHFVFMRIVQQRARPLLDTQFHLPVGRSIDHRLVLGATIFGVGWGLGGFCPGPALVVCGGGGLAAIVFVGTMAVGMLAQHFIHVGSAQPSACDGGADPQGSTIARELP